MLSFLAFVALTLGQADSAFRTLLDLDTNWSGKISIDGKDVIVNRLEVVATQLPCKVCTVQALRFAFQFEGDFRFPIIPASQRPRLGGITLPDVFQAVEPMAFRVQSSYHGNKGVPTCLGSELVLSSWSINEGESRASDFTFAIVYYRINTSLASNSIKLTGTLAIKEGHLEGTLAGKNMPPVKFAFAPLRKNKPEEK